MIKLVIRMCLFLGGEMKLEGWFIGNIDRHSQSSPYKSYGILERMITSKDQLNCYEHSLCAGIGVYKKIKK